MVSASRRALPVAILLIGCLWCGQPALAEPAECSGIPDGGTSPSVPTDVPAMPCEQLRALGLALCGRDYMDITDGQLSDQQNVLLGETFDCWKLMYAARENQIGEEVSSDEHPFTLAIFFHGGLVDRASGLTSAISLYPLLSSAGATPYFFIYNVGPTDSVTKGDRERGLFGLYDNADDAVFNRIGNSASMDRDRYISARDHDHVTRPEDWMRYGLPPLSIVGRNGSLAWSYMKQSILDGLDMTDRYDPTDPESCTAFNAEESDKWPHIARGIYNPELAGARSFLCHLGEFINGSDRGITAQTVRPRDVKLVLIGHSTGAIYITQFIRKAEHLWNGHAAQQKFDVILLAPAVSYRDFDRLLMEAGSRIHDLRVYTMDDWHERHDKVLSAVLGVPLQPLANYYDHSLLYAVSGIFEPDPDTPIVGLARFLPQFTSQAAPCYMPKDSLEEIQRVQAYVASHFGNINNIFVLSPSPDSAKPPYTTTAVDHGEFPSDGPTRDSIKTLVSDSAHNVAWPQLNPRDDEYTSLYNSLVRTSPGQCREAG